MKIKQNNLLNNGFSLVELLTIIVIISLVAFTGISGIKKLKEDLIHKAILKQLQNAISDQSKKALITEQTRELVFDPKTQTLKFRTKTLVNFKNQLKETKFGNLQDNSAQSIFLYSNATNSAGTISLKKCEIIISRYGALRDTC